MQLDQLNQRAKDVLAEIVEIYMQTGEPVGSKNLASRIDRGLSPATIRNVMAQLQDFGLLYAPHISAGRVPTPAGMRLFVDGLLQIGALSGEEKQQIEDHCLAKGRNLRQAMEEATQALSGLAHCASLVMAPKAENNLKHIEFVYLGNGRGLVVMVSQNGEVENRLIDVPDGVLPSMFTQASNFLNAKLANQSLPDLHSHLRAELENERGELDALTQKLITAGIAAWGEAKDQPALIVKGQAKLLEDVQALADLERVRFLFSKLEEKESWLRFLEGTMDAPGVKIFIGAENQLFNLAGCSLVLAPYTDQTQKIIGAVGVVGPTRLNYARIIPLVDYTAKVLGKIITS